MNATATYQSRLKVIRSQTARAVAARWDDVHELGEHDAEAFATRVTPIVLAGQLVAAKTTNAYIARRAGIQPIRLNPADVTGAAARRDVDPLEEYQRPFGIVRGALAEGIEPDEAFARGRSRLTQLAVTDVWLAMRATTAAIDVVTPVITGWVRVADPDACELCAAADGTPTTQAADLAGHPGCGCTNEPTFAETSETTATDPDAVDVHEHDELGPTLYRAGQNFAEVS